MVWPGVGYYHALVLALFILKPIFCFHRLFAEIMSMTRMYRRVASESESGDSRTDVSIGRYVRVFAHVVMV